QALGTHEDIQRFLRSAAIRLNAPLEAHTGNRYRFLPQHLTPVLKTRLADEGFDQPLLLDFHELHRSHPLVSILADHILEGSLSGDSSIAARCAVTETQDVNAVTTLYLLRLRHQLTYVRRREPFQLMAEETVTLAVKGRNKPEWITNEEVNDLLTCEPASNLPLELITREINQALRFLEEQNHKLEEIAQERAHGLLEDHRRVREASRDVGQYSVTACLPVDVIGVYVLLPAEL
ncbi:MAG: helicase SNF2, partial [Pseudomonadales bacterium]|nr:helicase SNF2 [Pseudomonadales bacterium]